MSIDERLNEMGLILPKATDPVGSYVAYIEVNKNGTLHKALPYERPIRILPDGLHGVVYKKRVYPIINSYKEIDKKRVEFEIN